MKKLKTMLSLLLCAGMLAQFTPVTVKAEEPQPDSRLLAVADELVRERHEKRIAEKLMKELGVKAEEKIPAIIILKDKPAVTSERSEASVLSQQEETIREVERITGEKIGKRVGFLVNGFSAKLTVKQLLRVRLLPQVSHVSRMKIFYPTINNAVEMGDVVNAWKENHLKGERTLISIIDTGVDPSHPDMRVSDPSKVKLTRDAVEALIKKNNLPGKYLSEKVPYGYDYADLDENVVGPADLDHGPHVAGIAAANAAGKDGVTGVAPEAQVLAMKVFGDVNQGAMSIDVIRAIEDSVKLGADVINMSLGSDNGFWSEEDGYEEAVSNAVKAGTAVIIAAGNSGVSTDDRGETNPWLGSNDVSTVGSPSTIPAALSVASVDNTKKMSLLAEYQAKDGKVHQLPYMNAGKFERIDDTVSYEVVDCGLGSSDEIPASVAGKLALIKRGTLTFVEKIQNAIDKKAAAVIIYNNQPGYLGMKGVEIFDSIPLVTADEVYGEELKAFVKKNKEVKLRFLKKEQYIADPDGGKMSSFTSWGLTPELAFKPEIAAPGGNIYSTVLNQKYGMMSGTSMASPFVAGSAALLMQSFAEGNTAGLDAGFDKMGLVKTMLENTAAPVKSDVKGLYASPRQQGAGLVQVHKALESKVLATAAYLEEDPDLKSYGLIALKEIKGPTKFRVKLHNIGTETRRFEIETGKVQTQSVGDQGVLPAVAKGAKLSGPSSVSIAPGETKKVEFTLHPGKEGQRWLEGFLHFKSKNKAQPDLHMPYVGFSGDWSEEPIFDEPLTVKDGKQQPSILSLIAFQSLQAAMEPAQAALFAHVCYNTTMVGDFPDIPIPLPLGNWEAPSYNPAVNAGISPNNRTKIFDVCQPQIGLFRNTSRLEYKLLDADKQVLRDFAAEEHVQKTSMNFVQRYQWGAYKPGFSWDGSVRNPKYDPKSDKEKEFITAEDGQYYIRIDGYLLPDSKPQSIELPVKVDTQAPTIEVKESHYEQGNMVVTAVIKDNEGGVGLSTDNLADYIELVDAMTFSRAEAELKVEPVADEADTYKLTIKGLKSNVRGKLAIIPLDCIYNKSNIAFIDTGDPDLIPLRPYNTGYYAPDYLESPVFVAGRPDNAKIIAAVKAFLEDGTPLPKFKKPSGYGFTFYNYAWSEIPQGEGIPALKDIFDEKKLPVLIKEPAQIKDKDGKVIEGAYLTINDKRAYTDPNKKLNNKFFIVLAEPNKKQSFEAKVHGADDSVLRTVAYNLYIDTVIPELNPEGVEFKHIKLTNGNPTRVLFVPENTKEIEIKGEISDNDLDWDFSGWYIDGMLGEYSHHFFGKKDDRKYSFKLPVDFSASPMPLNTFAAFDRASNMQDLSFYILKESDKSKTDEELAKLIDEGYPESQVIKDSERYYDFDKGFKVDDFSLQGAKLENDTLTLTGASYGIEEITVGGNKATMKPAFAPKYPETFSVDVQLKEGFNLIPVRAYYTKDGEKKSFKPGRLIIIYDTKAPEIDLSDETQSHIRDGVFYTNSETFKVSGVARDNTVGFTLLINDDEVLSVVDVGAVNGMDNPFDYTATVKDGDKLKFELRDLFYPSKEDEKKHTPEEIAELKKLHSKILEIPVKLLTEKPVITWSDKTPKNGSIVEPGVEGISVEAAEPTSGQPNPGQELKVSMNIAGTPYDGHKLTLPGTYEIEAVAVDAAGNETRETRTFTIGTAADKSKIIRGKVDPESGVQTWFYKGSLKNRKGKKLDESKLTLHAKLVDENIKIANLVMDEATFKDRFLVYDVFFTDQDGDRIDMVKSDTVVETRFPYAKQMQSLPVVYYLKPTAEPMVAKAKIRKAFAEQGTIIGYLKHFSLYAVGSVNALPKLIPDPKPEDDTEVPGYWPGFDSGSSPVIPGLKPGKQPGPQLGEQKAAKSEKPAGDAVPKTGEKLPLPWMGMICALAALGLLAARRPLLKKLSER